MAELKHFLESLVAGKDLSGDDAFKIGCAIASGEADPHQVSALLALLAARGESAEVVCGFARAMRSVSSRVTIERPVQEIVGTGGDGFSTINISTAAAVLTAACGVPVAKHGSVSVSSRSGAADVLRELGIQMLPPQGIADCVDQCGIAFMFAPLFHPAMKHVVPIRKALGIRTVFNILGPLLNPAGASRLLLGVYHPRLLRVYAEAVAELGVEHALIVHCCGMDELAPVGPSQCIEVTREGKLVDLALDPALFAPAPVPRCTIDDLKGGSPAENAIIMTRLLSGGDASSGPIADTIALNAGAALFVYGSASTVEEGFAIAQEVLRSGAAGLLLDKWAKTSTAIAEKLAASS